MGRPLLEKPGDKFGKWTLIEHPYKSRKWVCRCECGTVREVRIDALKAGNTLSCGCDTKRLQSEAKIRQGSKYDLTGQRFGKWTVLKYAGHSKWLCRCDCGTEQEIPTGSLKFGSTHMCRACVAKYFKENPTKATHKGSGTKLYRVYYAMHQRCENKKTRNYKRYGGRGIKVCEEWSGENGFLNFREWAYANGYKEGKEIDRINNDDGYSPQNCRWATKIENANNTSTNRFIEIDGEIKSIAEWARYFDVPYDLFRKRYVLRNWTLEATLNTPVGKGNANGNAERRI